MIVGIRCSGACLAASVAAKRPAASERKTLEHDRVALFKPQPMRPKARLQVAFGGNCRARLFQRFYPLQFAARHSLEPVEHLSRGRIEPFWGSVDNPPDRVGQLPPGRSLAKPIRRDARRLSDFRPMLRIVRTSDQAGLVERPAKPRGALAIVIDDRAVGMMRDQRQRPTVPEHPRRLGRGPVEVAIFETELANDRVEVIVLERQCLHRNTTARDTPRRRWRKWLGKVDPGKIEVRSPLRQPAQHRPIPGRKVEHARAVREGIRHAPPLLAEHRVEGRRCGGQTAAFLPAPIVAPRLRLVGPLAHAGRARLMSVATDILLPAANARVP